MGFSGMRAALMLALLVVLILGVTRFDLPGWLVPVGLIAGGVALKGWEARSAA
jgi:hypothetical protein